VLPDPWLSGNIGSTGSSKQPKLSSRASISDSDKEGKDMVSKRVVLKIVIYYSI
jgi:hypothetical protein